MLFLILVATDSIWSVRLPYCVHLFKVAWTFVVCYCHVQSNWCYLEKFPCSTYSMLVTGLDFAMPIVGMHSFPEKTCARATHKKSVYENSLPEMILLFWSLSRSVVESVYCCMTKRVLILQTFSSLFCCKNI